MEELPLQDEPREAYCLEKTFKYYSHALKRMYIEKYLDSASKIRADSVITTIKKYISSNPKALMLTEKDRDMRSRVKKKVILVNCGRTVSNYEISISVGVSLLSDRI